MDKIKEFWNKLSKQIKLLVGVGAVAIVAVSVIIGLALNNRTYAVLFHSVSSSEAQQIIGKLQEEQTPYQYQGNDILVPEDIVDITKARLVSEGYPQSGFTYDIFRNNVGMMTTESDRERFELYDLETRIGATIGMFEGVREAYVTIAMGDASRYALDDEPREASAQVVVVMENGGSPDEKVAKSIQLLVSRSIPGLVIDNVAVFDGNGLEVSRSVGGAAQTGREGEEIAQLIESQISAKILNVLGAVYGNGNVRIAVKASVNMERLLREATTYNTPEKIDEADKDGILAEESWYSEYSGDGEIAAGVAGAESNADIPQYNAGGGGGADNAYGSTNISRQYVINQIREQGEVNPGSLDDLTISVVINGDSFGGLTRQQLQNLIGNAAGMATEVQGEKITVASVPFYTIPVPQPEAEPAATDPTGTVNTLMYIIIGGGAFLLLLLILMIVLLRRRAKKKKATREAARPVRVKEGPRKPERAQPSEDDEILGLDPDNDKGMALRKNVRDFAEQNPEISAQLLKSWLNGGDRQ